MITPLSSGEASRILQRQTIGRLGCIADGEAYVVPVHYHFDGSDVFMHSLPGKKIDALRVHARACLQVDEIEDSYHWRSVLAFGRYKEITDERFRHQILSELFRRVPQMTPVESKLTDVTIPIIVFSLRVDSVTGVGEIWPDGRTQGD